MKQHYKIAIIGGCLSSKGGGAPRSMAQQAAVLTENGHSVSFFVGYSRKYPLTLDQFGLPCCPVISSRLCGPSVLGFFPVALYRLWKRAREFDFIHLNGAWNLTTFIAGRISSFRKVPYIITCRSHYGDYHFSRMPFLKRILFQVLEKRNIRKAYALHVTSDWEEKTSWRAVRFAQRVVKVPNPVDLADFTDPPSREESRDKLGLDPRGFYVVHLGRLGRQKNLSLLLHAFHQAGLGADASLLLVGPPEPQEKEALQHYAHKLNIQDRLKFIDFAAGRERCHWYAAANLFALPSHDENFCIAAVESTACGTHCLLSPHVGVVELLPADLVTVEKLEVSEWAKSIQEIRASGTAQRVPPPAAFDVFSSIHIGRQWNDFYTQASGDLA